MLISFEHQFIFIHIYKAAGSSVRKALAPYAHNPKRDWVGRFSRLCGLKTDRLESKIFPPHIRARELKPELPEEIFRDYFKFAFARNPWDWQVSLYHYMLKARDHKQHDLIKRMKDFDEYIEWRVNEEVRFQKDFVTDEEGNLLVDFVGKVENIEEDFAKVCGRIGIRAELPHINRSDHKNYRTYYNERTRRLVEEHFREDIEFFDYEF